MKVAEPSGHPCAPPIFEVSAHAGSGRVKTTGQMNHRLKQRPTAAIPRFVEIYTCYDALEAGRIHNLLDSHGFLCRVVDLTSGPLPLTIGKFGEKRIAVPHAEVVRAKRLLGAAIHDGYLSASGNFCGAQVDHRSVS
jgi:hypothetical protein